MSASPPPSLARRLRHDQGGSILFAMIGVIIVSALVIALVSRTNNTLQQTTSDRAFQTAVLGADAGVQQAVVEISELSDASTAQLTGAGTVGDVAYEWEANRNGSHWEVTSTGTRRERTRTVEAQVERASRFLLAAFSDVAFTVRGANGADSYNGRTGATDTGRGAVGSNGDITMNGNAFADRIDLYGDSANCSGGGCDSGEIVGHDEPYDINQLARDIEEEMAAQCSGGYTGYQASSSAQLQGGRTYCFSSMNFDESHGETNLQNATIDNPVTVYLTGNLTVTHHTDVNCPGCSGFSTIPDGNSFRIYSTGDSVSVGNQSTLAAAIAAPNASCHGSPSNAQAEIYGAMICNDLSNQGGWNFHFDEALLNLENGQWRIDEWREEVGGTTSFDS